MRLLFVTPRLPALPCHDGARVAVAQLVDQLTGRHTIGVVTATGGHPWTGRRTDALAVLNALARRTAARDLVERRDTWRTVAARYEALYARLAPLPPAEAAA